MNEVGQRVVGRLVAHGVQRMFGVPGGQSLPLYHGVATRPGEIEHTLMRDERSASFAADAYARLTGTVGVCDATVGPGATNLVSGLVEAYCSSIPTLAIVADIPRAWEHRRHLGSASQAFEQRNILSACAKWYARLDDPDALDDVVDHCIRVATSNRPGPVVLEIPDDVFTSPASEDPHPDGLSAAFPRTRTAPDPAAVAAAVATIAASRRPAVLVGGGAQISGAFDEVRALVDALGAPFATSISGKGIIEEDHPLALGVSGWFGTSSANRFLREADCLIAIGCKLGQGATLDWRIPGEDVPVVHIDIDAEEIGRNHPASVALQSDAKVGVRVLVDALAGRPMESEWDRDAISAQVDDWWSTDQYKVEPDADRIKPQQVARELAARLRDDDLVVSDASLSSGWAASGWRVRAPGRRMLAPRGLAGLGWGLPASVGASLAVRDLGRSGRVVCLAGDGAWGYSLAEIETLARFGLPVTSIVLNNQALSWNKHEAIERYGDDYVSHDFLDARWSTAAEALGARAVRVEESAGLGEALDMALEHTDGPTVIEVMSSEIETPVQAEAAYGAQSA